MKIMTILAITNVNYMKLLVPTIHSHLILLCNLFIHSNKYLLNI